MKKNIKIFCGIILLIVIILGILAINNLIFFPATMLMSALLLFSIAYGIRELKYKLLFYGLYVIGILLIGIAIFYMIFRMQLWIIEIIL